MGFVNKPALMDLLETHQNSCFANVQEEFGDAFVGQRVMPFRLEDELKARRANYIQG